jgi:uncharacterized repeat protein (TIGR01451 family)
MVMRFHIEETWWRGRHSRRRFGEASRRSRKPIARLEVERLESRRLLAVTINEFPIPTFLSEPSGIVSGPDGNLWFTELDGNKIGEINPITHAINEFPIPTVNGAPSYIAAGPDGNLWFTELEGNKIGEINPTAHAIIEFPLPTANSEPRNITSGPDGNLWFSEQSGNQIGEINPTTDAITEFPLPTGGSYPEGITTGPDGNLWFVEEAGNKIGEISPTTHAISEFPLSTPDSRPVDITSGPDGNLWFVEYQTSKIGQINPITHVISEFPVPNSRPEGITVGHDGNLWFLDEASNEVGEINPKTHASVEYPLPILGNQLNDLTTGTDGNIWFVSGVGNAVVGQVVVPPTPAAPDLALMGVAPDSVTLGDTATYSLTVINNGTWPATGLTLTDILPVGVMFVSATDGVTPSSGILTFNIGDLYVGASVSFSITVTPTAAGTLVNQASVNGNEADPTPADNSIAQMTEVVPPGGVDGPIVTSVERFGFHLHPTTLVLKFDKPLDSGRAQNLDNYRLVKLGCSGRAIAIESATYDSATWTVTLRPAHRLYLHGHFRLTVVGTEPGGVTDTLGNLLDDEGPGHPGSSFVTILSAKNLVLTSSPEDPRLPRRQTRLLPRDGRPK